MVKLISLKFISGKFAIGHPKRLGEVFVRIEQIHFVLKYSYISMGILLATCVLVVLMTYCDIAFL